MTHLDVSGFVQPRCIDVNVVEHFTSGDRIIVVTDCVRCGGSDCGDSGIKWWDCRPAHDLYGTSGH